MKSFKEFLMEEDGQNSGKYNSETLNDFLNNFLKSFNNNNVANIDQEKIVKYLICANLSRKLKINFEINGEDNKNLIA